MKRSLHKKGAPLGQHFLTSRAIADAIALAGRIEPGEAVLEVGPGKGILTRALLNHRASVIAIEKDSKMVALLKEIFKQELLDGALTLIEDDARSSVVRIPGFTQYKVIANIPYYITGELIRLFLTAKHQPGTIVFLVQKEVAERIARSEKESLLSLSVKAYGTPRYVRTVKAGSFSPPPSVDSAILAIENISRKNFPPEADPPSAGKNISEETFFKLLHAGFGQKRKTLVGNLKRAGLYKEEMALDQKVRAEDVPLERWLNLARLS